MIDSFYQWLFFFEYSLLAFSWHINKKKAQAIVSFFFTSHLTKSISLTAESTNINIIMSTVCKIV